MDNIANNFQVSFKDVSEPDSSFLSHFFFFFLKDVKITERTAQEISLYVPLDPLVIYLWPHLLAFSVCVCVCVCVCVFGGDGGEDGGRYNFSRLNSWKVICKHKDPLSQRSLAGRL